MKFLQNGGNWITSIVSDETEIMKIIQKHGFLAFLQHFTLFFGKRKRKIHSYFIFISNKNFYLLRHHKIIVH